MRYPVIRKPRGRFFPHGGNRRSERLWNDHKNSLNRRRHHGTDPLKDGYESDENPLISNPLPEKKPDIPI